MIRKISSPRRNIKDLAYESLKEAIISGELTPDKSITEEELANSLGISRTPLREAINLLINDGLILKRNSRLKVAPLTKQELNNLFSIREALEVMATRQATKNVDQDFISRLRKIMNKMKHAEDIEDTEEVVKLGSYFHEEIIKQANNPLLEDMLKSVLEKIKRYRHIGVSNISKRSQNAVEEHFEILQAIENQEVQEAETIMRKHIASSHETIALSKKIKGDENFEKI
ncbi:GntR family transcriptional regulator [Alkalicoccus saliphilus]|uniref:HTH gntR-type domain-containing protein n=1 Tax=Alkalicoccus saliphilus TaxID=200989 RepID=A0A2T4U417_9BACI|nr:GntR family transcriptional regulator [Alkalicoccus saliphilus]PTL38105.1 hypothetical protein C6Y45_12985 [Alkalicoccus saliphilus]